MVGQSQLSTGRKLFYGVVIFLCSLVILLSSIGIIGVWAVRKPISNTFVTVLKLVENTAIAVRQVDQRLDPILANLETLTSEIVGASEQLSKNVNDKGMLMVLLPEQKEQELIEAATEIQETFVVIRETLTNALELYRSISRLPFVSLPSLSVEQSKQIAEAVDKIQNLSENLRTEISNFRSGLSDRIDQVARVANDLSTALTQTRTALANLDARLTSLEALMVRLQEVIPPILLTIALVLTVLFAFVIYTQIEVVRLYVRLWHNPNQVGALESGVAMETMSTVEATEPLLAPEQDENDETDRASTG